MSHTNLNHRRTHNILLISKLLNQREGASPFTLVIDSLEQPAKPLLKEYLRRAALSKSFIIYLAFEAAHVPRNADLYLPCWNKTPGKIVEDVSAAVAVANKQCLLIIDSLATICTQTTEPRANLSLTTFLMSLLQPPKQASHSISMVAVYHNDVPIASTAASYLPSPSILLEYLATTVISLHSFTTLVAEKHAQARSLSAPLYGLLEQKDGIMIGLKPQTQRMMIEERGIVIQLEHRRKSGRGVLEWYFLPDKPPHRSSQGQVSTSFREHVILLDDHPSLKPRSQPTEDADQDLAGMTFQLGLTDRQRLERDGVVLPYFDAQKAGGGGDGGRILYDMGEEDDFDEEEDEI